MRRAGQRSSRCQEAADIIGAEAVIVLSLDPGGRALRWHAWSGVSPELAETWRILPLDDPLPSRHVFRTGRAEFYATWSELLTAYPALASAPTRRAVASAIVPVAINGTVVGVWAAEMPEPHPFTDPEKRRLVQMAAEWADELAAAAGIDGNGDAGAPNPLEPRHLVAAAFHRSPVAATVTDPAGRFLAANGAAHRLFRRPVGELESLGVDDVLLDPSAIPARTAPDGETSFEGAVYRSTLLRPDGSTLPVEVTALPIRSAGGQVIGTLSRYRDLTEALELERVRAWMSQLYQHQFVGFVAGEGAHVWEANDSFLRIIGRTRDELDGGEISWRAITPEEWRPVDAEAFGVMLAEGSCPPVEKEYLRADGTRARVLISGVLLDASSYRWASVVADVTDLRRAEQAAAATARNATLVGLLDELVDAVVLLAPVHDPAGDVTDFVVEYANAPARDVRGRKLADHGGRSMSELFPGFRAASLGVLRGVLATGKAVESSGLAYTAEVDGGVASMWVDQRVSAVDGRIVLSYRDVTERYRQRAALEQTSQRLDRERATVQVLRRLALPEELPQVPGVEVGAGSRPAAGDRVAGDFYDVVALGGGRLGLVIGDVVGHGIDAALTMGQLRAALRMSLALRQDPGRALADVTSVATTICDEPFPVATAFVAIVDPARRLLHWARAGHLPALVLRGESRRWLERPGGLPIGVDPAERYPGNRLTLEPGDLLVLVTDGVVERRGRSLDASLDEVAALAHHSLPLGALTARLLDHADGVNGDDATVPLVRCTGA